MYIFKISLVIDYFENWLEEFKRLNGNYPSLSIQTALEAINAVSKQKHGKLIEKVVYIYQGIQMKEHFVCVIKNFCKNCSFTTACRMATALQLYNSFPIEDFVLPLILQDKCNLAEEFISHNVNMQKETITFLDKHVNYPCDILYTIT